VQETWYSTNAPLDVYNTNRQWRVNSYQGN
jgi:hypothetical protein